MQEAQESLSPQRWGQHWTLLGSMDGVSTVSLTESKIRPTAVPINSMRFFNFTLYQLTDNRRELETNPASQATGFTEGILIPSLAGKAIWNYHQQKTMDCRIQQSHYNTELWEMLAVHWLCRQEAKVTTDLSAEIPLDSHQKKKKKLTLTCWGELGAEILLLSCLPEWSYWGNHCVPTSTSAAPSMEPNLLLQLSTH